MIDALQTGFHAGQCMRVCGPLTLTGDSLTWCEWLSRHECPWWSLAKLPLRIYKWNN